LSEVIAIIVNLGYVVKIDLLQKRDINVPVADLDAYTKSKRRLFSSNNNNKDEVNDIDNTIHESCVNTSTIEK